MPLTAVTRRPGTGAVAFVAVGAAFCGLLAWTWPASPDVLVDFGRELYVPWQITQGRHLYADIAWFNGPLSPYWNAAVFGVFGVGLSTLIGCNVAVLAAIVGLTFHLVRRMTDALSATAACLCFLALFAFAQYVGLGNYNYLCPYAHEATHGLLLALAALAVQEGDWPLRRGLRLGLAGGLQGLVFLTKPELFVASMLAHLAFLTLRRQEAVEMRPGGDGSTHAGGETSNDFDGTAPRSPLLGGRSRTFSTPRQWGQVLRDLARFAVGLALPVLAAWLLLAQRMPVATAWRGVLGAWPALVQSDVARQTFYRRGMGLDDPLGHLLGIAAWTGGLIALLTPALLLAMARRSHERRLLRGGIAVALVVGPLALLADHVRWAHCGRALPAVVAAVAVAALLGLRRDPHDRRWLQLLVFCVFALALTGKMALNPRIYHYGFVLAMPAAMVAVAGLVGVIPAWLEAHGHAGHVFRAASLALLGLVAGFGLTITAEWRARRPFTVASGVDQLAADATGRDVQRALDWLRARQQAAPDQALTLAVVPEGVTINYLARLRNPTPYVNFMPPEFAMYGETALLAAFLAQPPDLLLVTHKDTSDYGVRFFGRDYGQTLYASLRARYQTVAQFGDPPLRPGSRFGIEILERRGRP